MTGTGSPKQLMERTCLACHTTVGPMQCYEHDGKVDWFHDTCVGSWLMRNPDSVISFTSEEVDS